MQRPIFNKQTGTEVDAFVNNPTHALAIIGSTGSGKKFVASYIMQQILGDEADVSSYIIVRPDEKGSISIEQSRKITQFLKLVSNKGRRVIIIYDAHKMTNEAQNALLKTLEEPPADTVMIMTLTAPSDVLPTIMSRLRAVYVKPVSKADVQSFLTDVSNAEFDKAWAMSEGRLGLLHSLVEDSDHSMLTHLQLAKDILACDAYERLTKINSLEKDDIQAFLEAMQIVASAGFSSSVKRSPATTARWHHIRKAIAEAIDDYQTNLNKKLLLTNLMLKI